MNPLGRRVLVLLLPLVPLVLCVPVLVSLLDVVSAAQPECRRTLGSYPELAPGDRRPAVRTLQCAINDVGLGPVTVDGYYGPRTKAPGYL